MPCSPDLVEGVISDVCHFPPGLSRERLTRPVQNRRRPAATTSRVLQGPRLPPGSARSSSVRLPPPTPPEDGGDGSSGPPSTHPRCTNAYRSSGWLLTSSLDP